MPKFYVNKGIGKPAEFKGLKSQYLFLFAGGLLVDFVLVVILYMIGLNNLICIGTGVTLAGFIVWFSFYANERFGEYGLMKRMARRSHPRYIINRVPFNKLLKERQL